MLWRAASKSAASSVLSSDCRRVISCGVWLVCALMSSSCRCQPCQGNYVCNGWKLFGASSQASIAERRGTCLMISCGCKHCK